MVIDALLLVRIEFNSNISIHLGPGLNFPYFVFTLLSPVSLCSRL